VWVFVDLERFESFLVGGYRCVVVFVDVRQEVLGAAVAARGAGRHDTTAA
jgi:hypothetical protein